MGRGARWADQEEVESVGSSEVKAPATKRTRTDIQGGGESEVWGMDDNGYDDRMQIIGETIYDVGKWEHPEWAGKITGMLLERGREEGEAMIGEPTRLRNGVVEAAGVLREKE